MNDFDRPGAALDDPPARRFGGSRLAELGGRLSKTFGATERIKPEVSGWEADGDLEYGLGEAVETVDATERFEQSRFPIARHGYDRQAVDQHMAELERELARLRTQDRSDSSVAAEIERIGEQTSGILLVAHEKSRETIQQAQEQADRCVADAASNAVAITEEASRRLRQLDSETESVWHERARLVEDVRNLSSVLATLAQEASERFPAEHDRTDAPSTATGQPFSGSHGD